jgi:ABC-type proline/glycine betaine transport system substrate-binding protein
MKYILAVLLLTAVSCSAEEVKYEVSITVVYNAVSAEEANQIAEDVLTRHKTACKNKVEIKKVIRGGVGTGNTLIYDGSGTLEWSPGDYPWTTLTTN